MAIKHSIAGFADTPQQKNFRFNFKVSNMQQAKAFLNRAAAKHWHIRAAWHCTHEHGIRLNSVRLM